MIYDGKMKRIRTALISVYDKTGLGEILDILVEKEVVIYSTGGTGEWMAARGYEYRDIASMTGFVELLDGRVKTLHPMVHAGILAKRNEERHMAELAKLGAVPFDMVIVNFYPFGEAVEGKINIGRDSASTEEISVGEAVEFIDIGGPTMVRGAAKNGHYVTVVHHPSQYGSVAEELNRNDGFISAETRFALAASAFRFMSGYDAQIASFFEEKAESAGIGLRDPVTEETVSENGEVNKDEFFPQTLRLRMEKSIDLRYGENPHQRAAFYLDGGTTGSFRLIKGGRKLSFNNIADIDAAMSLVAEFTEVPAAAVIKHQNPCGVGIGMEPGQAFAKALKTDPISAFGGIVAFNMEVDAEVADQLRSLFIEVVVAPSFDDEAMKILSKKKKLRIVTADPDDWRRKTLDFRHVHGGFLVQDRDISGRGGSSWPESFEVVSERKPTDFEYKSMLFAWKVVGHLKSNASVYAYEDRTLGIGAGQMSRIDSVVLAGNKADDRKIDMRGSTLATDGFFPFPDSIVEAADSGATAIIQPGGSIRDDKVIKAVNDLKLTMVFTGERRFRH